VESRVNIFRLFLATIIAVERNKCYSFWVYVYSVTYPAFNALVIYCHLWPALPSTIVFQIIS
jgi:hypothetical protein